MGLHICVKQFQLSKIMKFIAVCGNISHNSGNTYDFTQVEKF